MMATTVIVLSRVLFAMLLGFVGLLVAGQAITALFFNGFVFFGVPGAMMILGLCAGGALIYASGRLFRSTLAVPAI